MLEVPAGYSRHDGPPDVETYVELRRAAGLTPPTLEQAHAGIDGAWCAVHLTHDATGDVVGMGRVISDGGWYFHVIDMAVHPDHHGRGLGTAVLRSLLTRIRTEAPAGRAYVSLMGDTPGQRLYERLGFRFSRPASEGMTMWLETDA